MASIHASLRVNDDVTGLICHDLIIGIFDQLKSVVIYYIAMCHADILVFTLIVQVNRDYLITMVCV